MSNSNTHEELMMEPETTMTSRTTDRLAALEAMTGTPSSELVANRPRAEDLGTRDGDDRGEGRHDEGKYFSQWNWKSPFLVYMLLVLCFLLIFMFFGILLSKDMKLSSEVRKLQETSKDLFPCGSRSREWEYFDGRCYYFSVEKETWHTARSQCQAKNSDLVVIHDDAEQNFLQSQARKMVFWIGLHDLKEEGEWTWVDATDYRTGFTKWNRGEPNDHQGKEDCAMISETGGWNDMHCTFSTMYVCEKPLPS